MSTNYAVIVEKYAERHFISRFEKKHKSHWETTWNAVEEEFKRIDGLLGVNSIVEIIIDARDIKICKTEFRVAGPGPSRHASGNRCIIAVHHSTNSVHVLLVYNKTDLGANETAEWKSLVKANYPQYAGFL
jgi:hypothetical protein